MTRHFNDSEVARPASVSRSESARGFPYGLLLAVLACPTCLASGCAHIPRVSIPKARAVAPQDPGTPAVVSGDKSITTMPVPAGSVVKVTPPPPPPTADGTPAAATAPVVETTLAAPTVLRIEAESHAASTGTVDSSVAIRRVDNDARKPLLYFSLVALAGAGIFMWLKYPTPALMCGAGAVLLFLAWQIASLPSWIILIGAVVVAGSVFLYFGHERGEKFSTSFLRQPVEAIAAELSKIRSSPTSPPSP